MTDTKLTVTGRSFSNHNSGKLDKDGYWNVVVIMDEEVFFSDGTSRAEKIEAACLDRDFDTAHKTALSSALIQLREEVYDKGFASLVEAREASGTGVASSTNSDTYTQ